MTTRWQVSLPLREAYVDYLGHVTAAAHLTLFEEAHFHWLAEVMGDTRPAFVLARLELDYRRELMLSDGPVIAHLAPVELGRSAVTVEEELISARGVHTKARAVMVRWDQQLRHSIPFPPAERERITTLLRP